MSYTSVRLKLLHLCLSLSLLLVLLNTSLAQDDEGLVDISFCLPANSTLALTGKCRCLENRGLRACAVTPFELYELDCEGLDRIPAKEGEIYDTVFCLDLSDSPMFKKLDFQQLSLFPSLEGLVINSTGLEEIADNIADAVPKLRNIYVENSQLTSLPKLGALSDLTFVSFAYNKLKAINQSRFRGATNMLTLDLSNNLLTELRGTIFTGLCNMRILKLGENYQLREIEDSVFENTNIQALDLSNTAIRRLPYTTHLGGWLETLDLRGTPDLHVFHDRGSIVDGQSFGFLHQAHFFYHAHCCQITRSNYSYYQLDSSFVSGRDVSSLSNGFFQGLYDRFVGGSRSVRRDVTTRRRRVVRETVPDEPQLDVCIDYIDLNIVPFPEQLTTPEPTTMAPTTTEQDDVCHCNRTDHSSTCNLCLASGCEEEFVDCSAYMGCSHCSKRRRRRASEGGDGASNNETEQVLPEGWAFHENATDLICSVQVNEVVSIVTQVYRPCNGRVPSPVTTENPVPSPSPTTATYTATMASIDLLPSPSATEIMSASSSGMVAMVTESPTPPSSCVASVVEASCIYSLSPTSLPNRDWFYPNPTNTSFICIPVEDIASPLTCIKYADLNIVLFPEQLTTPEPTTMAPTTTEQDDVCHCDRTDHSSTCNLCLASGCEEEFIDCSAYMGCSHCSKRRRRRASEGGDGASNNETEQVLPEGWAFHENATDLICTDSPQPVTILVSVHRACDNESRGNCTAELLKALCTYSDPPPFPPSESWFYPDPTNASFICVALTDIPGTTHPITTIATTTVQPTNNGSTDMSTIQSCKNIFFSLESTQQLIELRTTCGPSEDPFNPCEDLLGEDDVLRSFIWVVIILALLGNSLVILVFLGYTVIVKRTKIELFIVHFFYFNLALADLLMGIYLLAIAVVDLRTIKNFSMFDVQWRTGGGCEFAGFCAITSTMVSVYVLTVITLERLVTFSRAMKSSRMNKITGSILMAIGWGFGITMGILPLVGVSDYKTTAICLPFDVSSRLDLAYILFLLLFTGLSFTGIAISYIIIFYQVFYRQKRTISVSDNKRKRTELKVALRMGVLVLTNFVCWFPIALLGIAAAVGDSLVSNVTFAKWVMVFIFPINACLNPILYSALTKVFRDNLVLLFGRCGLCKKQVEVIRRSRAGFTPSVISRSQVSSEAGLVSTERRGTIMERFRNFSITSSTMDLLGRRSSTMSQISSEERYRIELTAMQKRRSSEYSSASSEDILGVRVTSRRGSALSGGSIEDAVTFSNPGFRSGSPVNGSDSNRHPRISLGAVPEEEGEILSSSYGFSHEEDGKFNPGYLDSDTLSADDGVSEGVQKNGHRPEIADNHLHHQIIDSEIDGDSSHSDRDSREPSIAKESEERQTENEASPTSSDDISTISRTQEIVSIEFD